MTRRRVNQVSGAVLALGLAAALAISLLTPPEEIDPLLGEPLANKKYLRELRVIGGRANVVAAEFNEWFAGLWHGRALGGTVAVLTVAGVLVFRFVAFLPPAPEPESPGKSPAAPPDRAGRDPSKSSH